MKSRIGEKHLNNNGDEFKIIEYISTRNCTVQFKDGFVSSNRQYRDIKRGEVKNPYYPTVCGIGYVGEGKHSIFVDGKVCLHYYTWKGMLERCYDKNLHNKRPSYIGCTLDSKWMCHQNFALWFIENFNPETMDGWHLDKDILVKGNKIYSPETCCFVPQEINLLFAKRQNNRGEYPIGVSKSGNKFMSKISINGERKYLGTFDTPEEAFQAYKTAKEKYIKEVADKWKPLIEEKIHQALYNYQVEITD